MKPYKFDYRPEEEFFDYPEEDKNLLSEDEFYALAEQIDNEEAVFMTRCGKTFIWSKDWGMAYICCVANDDTIIAIDLAGDLDRSALAYALACIDENITMVFYHHPDRMSLINETTGARAEYVNSKLAEIAAKCGVEFDDEDKSSILARFESHVDDYRIFA